MNTSKSLWMHFSCLLHEGIAKICKKMNSHDGIMAALSLSALKKPSWEWNFLCIFAWQENTDKCCKYVLRYLFIHSITYSSGLNNSVVLNNRRLLKVWVGYFVHILLMKMYFCGKMSNLIRWKNACGRDYFGNK